MEHTPSTSFDDIEDLGEVDLDNSSEDLNHVDSTEVEVYSSDKTSCQYLKITSNNIG